MNRAWSLLATLVLGLCFAAPAGAQTPGPAFEDSGPDQGDFEHEAPREIFIQFSESLGPSSSTQVYDECGRRLDDGAADIRGDTLWAQLVLRPAGRYLVVYSASGSAPGSGTTEGSFTFRVHFGPSCGGEPGDGPGDGPGGQGGHGNGPGDGPGAHGGHGNGPGDGPGDGPGHGGHWNGPGDGPGGRHAGSPGGHMGHSDPGTHVGHDRAVDSHEEHPTGSGRHSSHDTGKGPGGSKHEKSHGGHGSDRGRGEGGEGREVALRDTGSSDLAPPPGTEIALTAMALCIALGLFGGFALKASGR